MALDGLGLKRKICDFLCKSISVSKFSNHTTPWRLVTWMKFELVSVISYVWRSGIKHEIREVNEEKKVATENRSVPPFGNPEMCIFTCALVRRQKIYYYEIISFFISLFVSLRAREMQCSWNREEKKKRPTIFLLTRMPSRAEISNLNHCFEILNLNKNGANICHSRFVFEWMCT